jgi:MFS family permease
MSALGAVLGIWLGLLLTTAATPFPLGLNFALAGPSFANGWRWMYGVGALLALVGILIRFELPESPRWLLAIGQVAQADKIVTAMENRAAAREQLAEITEEVVATPEKNMGYREIFGNRLYVNRTLILLVVWLLAYVTVYIIASGFTSVLVSLGYPPPEAGLITAVGTVGFVLSAIFAAIFGERLERKAWLPIMAVVTIIGCVLIAVSGQARGTDIPWGSFIGAIVLFFGFNAWVPITYAWSAESYPTRARVTGFGLVDGVGHISGGVGVALIVPILPQIGVLASLLLIGGFLVASAVVAQFGSATRGRQLDEVSP